MSLRGRASRTILAVSALALAGNPATADWLVMHDGSRVETKGPWEIKGKLVVFTQTNGTLGSMRSDSVDLTASAEATAEAVRAKEPVKEPVKQAVIVLTDDDVGHVSSESLDEVPAEGAAPTPPPATGKLTIADWDKTEAEEGTEISGNVRNDTADTASNVTLMVVLYDTNGRQIARGAADLSSNVLSPGGVSSFSASFPTIADFAMARFESNATFFRSRNPATEEGAAEEIDAEAPPQ